MLINNKSLIKTVNKLNLTDNEREKFNKFGEDDRGNFLYNGKPIIGGATAEQIAQIEANTQAIGTEELPTTAKTLKGAIAETFQSVSSGKTLIASAITDKGVSTSNDDTFQVMANNILRLSSTEEITYTFNTVSDMKNSKTVFVEGDIIKVLGYYTQGDLIESSLKYTVMTYENWLNSYPEDMRLVSYTTGWWGYKYIKMFVDEYGNHTLKNGLIAKLIIEDNIVYAEQYGCRGDGVNLDNTAFRHLFGLNKRDITIKFQHNKTYVIGTEPYNCMYYDEEKFNVVKDNNLLANNTACCVNEYATQGGQFVGGWNTHIKPCLVNAKNVTIDGSGSKIFIPDNQFEDKESMNVFSWLELTNYINGLEIKNFIIDGNGLNQITRPSCSKDAICTNHGLFYGGGTLEALTKEEGYINQITNNNINVNCYKSYTAQMCNVYIHDNIIKNMGASIEKAASGDLGGDGILILPPPLMDNVEISNNQFFNLGRWVIAIDLVNDSKECSNIKINNNTYDYDENNIDVTGSYRGLGWIDFECTRKFINLEVKNNNIHGLCGFAFNGGTNARGNNIQIYNNILKSPALNYKSAYPYDFYFYNLNADNLIISGNTIINELNNDNLRSLGYSIHNLTYSNNRIYKEQIIDLSYTGNILIDSNVRVDKNNEIISDYKKVIAFSKVNNNEITEEPAHVIFVNNDGGFGASFNGCVTFPKNFDFIISNNSNTRYNANFSKCNKPVIDGKYIDDIRGSLRCASIYNQIEDKLNNFESNGYILKENQILLHDNAKRIIANNYGYLPITSNEFAVVEKDVNNMNSAINTNQIFYTSKNAYIPLNNGTLGSESILEDNIDIYNCEIESGDVKLKYLCPIASTSIIPYEIYGNVDLELGKIAEFNANDYNSPQESYIDKTGNYTMTYLKSNEAYTSSNLVDGEFISYNDGGQTSGTYFSLFEGEDFGEEFTIVIYGSKLYHLGIGSVSDSSNHNNCIFDLFFGSLYVYGSNANVGNIDKHMITIVIKKGGEPIIYFNDQRIDTPIKYIPIDINYSTDFRLLIGKSTFLDFGYTKFAQSKFRNIIAYNRRLNYNEIQELYNSLPVVNEFILNKETLNINEEETGIFTVSLKENPLTTKKVSISTDNQYITVEPSELIFNSNNYNTPQTVTINSSKDNNEIEDTAVIKINSSNISKKQLNVTIADKGPEGTPAEN